MNLSGVAIAQGIAGVPLMSGMGLRLSMTHSSDAVFRQQQEHNVDARFTLGHGLVLIGL